MRDLITKGHESRIHSQNTNYDSIPTSAKNEVTQRKSPALGLSAFQVAQRKMQEAGQVLEGDSISKFHRLKAGSSNDTIQKKETTKTNTGVK